MSASILHFTTYFDKKYLLFIIFFMILIPGMAAPSVSKKEVLTTVRQLYVSEFGSTKGKLLMELDSMTLLGNKLSETDFFICIRKIGDVFREKGKHLSVIKMYLSEANYLEQLSDRSASNLREMVGVYIILGASHEELGLWNKALDFDLMALRYAEENGFQSEKAMIYNNISAIYFNREEYVKAESYIRKALDINLTLKNKKELFNNYNNLAGLFLKKGEYDKGLEYALMAIQQLDSKKDANLYYFMQMNIATIYMQKKDFVMSISCLRNAMIHQEALVYDFDLVQTYHLLSRVYDKIGVVDSSRYYLQKSLRQARKVRNAHIESSILRSAAFLYHKDKNYQRAYEALERSIQINDSISEIDNQKKLNDLEIVYEAEKRERENDALTKQILVKEESAQRLVLAIIAVILLMISLTIFFFYYLKSKDRVRKADELLLMQDEKLREKEKEMALQKEIVLNNTIDKKNRELTSYTLYMVKNNEFILGLTEELKQLLLEINPRDSDRKNHISEIISKLQQHTATNNWDEFKYYFEQVHLSFYENLDQHYPELTVKDKRLCAFLRLGLSTKEISAITFKEVRSVESARNRLRKKMGINPEENLVDFLSQFSLGGASQSFQDH